MKYAHTVAFILLAVGGLAWGIYGLIGLDVVSSFLGDTLAKIIFIAVGVATVYEIITHKWRCKECTGQTV